MLQNKEAVGKCAICHKEHTRETTNEWYYHVSRGVVCRKHQGVEEWYRELFIEARMKYNKYAFINRGSK